MPDPGSAAPATREQVFAWMAETGATIAGAAEHFGVPVGTIKSWRSRAARQAAMDADAEPVEVAQPPPPPAPRARVMPPPPIPPRPPRQEPAPKPPPPPPAPKPNAAETLPPDDRAELVALVRKLRKRLADIATIVDSELAGAIKNTRSPNSKLIDELTRSAAATAGEMERVLKAHPGLMALVEDTAPPDADAAAANIDRLLG